MFNDDTNCSDFRRYALSTLVNTLLDSETPTPFEFLINGAFLRTSLDEYLTANGVSAENVLSLEYVKARLPPAFLASFPHDDWVSGVDILGTGPESTILTACYDGHVRLWNPSGELLTTSLSTAHESVPANGGQIPSLKTARFAGIDHVVSAGRDRTVRIWKYGAAKDDLTTSLSPQIELYGHSNCIDSVAVHRPSNRIVSASQDGSVGLWSLRKSDAPEAPASLLPSAASQSAKRRKMGASSSVPRRGPLSMMKGHRDMVQDVVFAPQDTTVAYSCSVDKALKTWDLTTSTCVDTRSTSLALHSLTALSSLNLVAAGAFQKIFLIDPRASATTITAMTLRGHSNVVSTTASDPDSTYGLLSGSYDGTCRIWDLRSARNDNDGRFGESVYTIERESTKGQGRRPAGEQSKVFDVTWHRHLGIMSVGEDKQLQVNQTAEGYAS